MRFRPKLWPTLFTVPALIVLLALGFWQVQRLQWKEALIEKLQTRSTAAAIALPENRADLNALEYRRVTVTGRFDHAHEFHLVNRSLNGNPGIHIVTPLLREGKPAVLVSRGWVPFDKKPVSARAEGQVAGMVTVEGIVRLIKGPGRFTPENEAQKNFWFFIDPKAMAAASGLPIAPDFYVLSGDKVPGGFPVAHQWKLDIRNDHLQYAITWFALALGLAVIYIVYHRRSGEGDGSS
jgi:surfeit locus 1 family protein